MSKPCFNRGVSLIEVIVASGMLSVFLVGASFHYKKALDVSEITTQHIQSSFLLEEGVEAVKSLRDESWSGKIANLKVGTDYYLYWSGTKWTPTTTPEMVENMFTRTFTLASTTRDVNYDIDPSGGTVDDGSRKVTIHVSWKPKSSNTLYTESVEAYIMNLFNN